MQQSASCPWIFSTVLIRRSAVESRPYWSQIAIRWLLCGVITATRSCQNFRPSSTSASPTLACTPPALDSSATSAWKCRRRYKHNSATELSDTYFEGWYPGAQAGSYDNNARCTFKIKPSGIGANDQITLKFKEFGLEDGYDKLFVRDADGNDLITFTGFEQDGEGVPGDFKSGAKELELYFSFADEVDIWLQGFERALQIAEVRRGAELAGCAVPTYGFSNSKLERIC